MMFTGIRTGRKLRHHLTAYLFFIGVEHIFLLLLFISENKKNTVLTDMKNEGEEKRYCRCLLNIYPQFKIDHVGCIRHTYPGIKRA